jgi:polyferredoxin
VFLPTYFSEHLAFIVTLAHHKIVVVSFLIAVGLILVVALFVRRMREASGTARQ